MRTLVLLSTLLAVAAAGRPRKADDDAPDLVVIEANDTSNADPTSADAGPIPAKPYSSSRTPAQPYPTLGCGNHSLPVGSYVIKSLNYPNYYENNYDCTYTLSPDADGKSLSISCSAFDVEGLGLCASDYLQFNDKKYCGNNVLPRCSTLGT